MRDVVPGKTVGVSLVSGWFWEGRANQGRILQKTVYEEMSVESFVHVSH